MMTALLSRDFVYGWGRLGQLCGRAIGANRGVAKVAPVCLQHFQSQELLYFRFNIKIDFRMLGQTFKNNGDTLHKDAGRRSGWDYAEQAAWVLFLKLLDDQSKDRARSAMRSGANAGRSLLLSKDGVPAPWPKRSANQATKPRSPETTLGSFYLMVI